MATRADAHAFMVRAEPRVGSKVKKAPTEVRICFSESVQSTLSSIKILAGNGKQVDKKDTHLDPANRALLHVSLAPALPPGTYRVIWHVTSVDTHVTNGDFKFQIVP
jgi:methionine-rich copper-binding protein CopC